jgi:F-type H+-transporting ATPase subunit epsilon
MRSWTSLQSRQKSFTDLLGNCSYIQFSGIAARVVRNALKPELAAAAAKRLESPMSVRTWEGGKPVTAPRKYANKGVVAAIAKFRLRIRHWSLHFAHLFFPFAKLLLSVICVVQRGPFISCTGLAGAVCFSKYGR